jgi:hypothetical protein
LGSVIAWDILSILKDNMEKNVPKGDESDPINIDRLDSPRRIHSLATLDNATDNPLGYQACAKGTETDSKHGTWGPCLPQKMLQTIPFTPHLTVFLGSPVGLFLTLRGAHAVFDEMRAIAEAERASLIPCDNDDEPPPVFNVTPIICSPFSLPTTSLYNIFHPSDPVAYRIEVSYFNLLRLSILICFIRLKSHSNSFFFTTSLSCCPRVSVHTSYQILCF